MPPNTTVDVDRARQAVHQVALALTRMYVKLNQEHHFLRPTYNRDKDVTYAANIQGMSSFLLHKVCADDGLDFEAKLRTLDLLAAMFTSHPSAPHGFSYSTSSKEQEIIDALGERFNRLMKIDQNVSDSLNDIPAPATHAVRKRRT